MGKTYVSQYDSQRSHPLIDLGVKLDLCVLFVQTAMKCQDCKFVWAGHITSKIYISEDLYHEIQWDIFRNKDVEGLYRTKQTKVFEESQAKLRRKWNALKMEERKKEEAFHFVKNKAKAI